MVYCGFYVVNRVLTTHLFTGKWLGWVFQNQRKKERKKRKFLRTKNSSYAYTTKARENHGENKTLSRVTSMAKRECDL